MTQAPPAPHSVSTLHDAQVTPTAPLLDELVPEVVVEVCVPLELLVLVVEKDVPVLPWEEVEVPVVEVPVVDVPTVEVVLLVTRPEVPVEVTWTPVLEALPAKQAQVARSQLSPPLKQGEQSHPLLPELP